ncbi:MAG: RimJ/RimL family protein N-acetyltransferase [Oceanospirillaceae bacterium]|jgi:RimJ/RimL family protein N-acetyltransferase
MQDHYNHLDQPISFDVPNWSACEFPPHTPMLGQYCNLVPLDPSLHAQQLYQAFCEDSTHKNWTYLPIGPFADFAAFNAWLEDVAAHTDPLFFSIIDKKTQQAIGMASYLRITPQAGTIEVGHIHFSAKLQKTPLATEAMYLMMQRVFEQLGYRRYEWKCDSLNLPSKKAAQRLGFSFEGIFRQALIYKQRNRDTAWFSVIDNEWPALKLAFEAWLHPDNFKINGQQLKSLSTFIPPL